MNITVYLMQHLQSLKTEKCDEEDGEGQEEGERKEWTSDCILKGRRHHCCIPLHPACDSSLAASLSEKCDRTFYDNSVYTECKKDGGGGSENQSGCSLSLPPSRKDLSLLSCPLCIVILGNIDIVTLK